MGVFLVKTVKRILFSQSQYTTFDMEKYNYLLLIIAIPTRLDDLERALARRK